MHRVVILGVIVAVFSTVSGLSAEDRAAINEIMAPILAECGKEHDVSEDKIKAAKDLNDIDALNPCFYACVLKKLEYINEEGLYVPEMAKEGHKKVFYDEEVVKKLDTITDICTRVNDKEVSDGDKGCERAKLLVTCFHENKDDLEAFDKE